MGEYNFSKFANTWKKKTFSSIIKITGPCQATIELFGGTLLALPKRRYMYFRKKLHYSYLTGS